MKKVTKTKVIRVVCTEFKAPYTESGMDVNSLMYDDETGEPIMDFYTQEIEGETRIMNFHVGQVSSSFHWAHKDIGMERYGEQLRRIFPDFTDFEFKYIDIPYQPSVFYVEDKYGGKHVCTDIENYSEDMAKLHNYITLKRKPSSLEVKMLLDLIVPFGSGLCTDRNFRLKEEIKY